MRNLPRLTLPSLVKLTFVLVTLVRSIETTSRESASTTPTTPNTTPGAAQQVMSIGPCKWILNGKCPDTEIRFYLFTRQNMMDRQNIHIDDSLEKSNITESFFNPMHPTKIIIHGYNSDMFLNSLISMKDEYLQRGEYNVIYVDWSVLSLGPCYFSAVHNTKHTGACTAQLVERILDLGSEDIHVIGFSLGAQLANYIAQNLKLFQLPRITGLDPALPLFITSSLDEKLDPTDAEFVDVIHTNALVQGKLERCGHVDFYMNGGIFQPGCTGNIFACSHQRAPAYFTESIRSAKGFWGWACSSYISYMLGMCPPTNFLVEAGENATPVLNGLFLITTADSSPFALGKWTDTQEDVQLNILSSPRPSRQHSPLLKEVDEWGKLEGDFNNIDNVQKSYYEDTPDMMWTSHELDKKSSLNSRRNFVSYRNRSNYVKFRSRNSEVPKATTSSNHLSISTKIIDKSIFHVPRISRSQSLANTV